MYTTPTPFILTFHNKSIRLKHLLKLNETVYSCQGYVAVYLRHAARSFQICIAAGMNSLNAKYSQTILSARSRPRCVEALRMPQTCELHYVNEIIFIGHPVFL